MTGRQPRQDTTAVGATLGLFGIAFTLWWWLMATLVVLARILWRAWLWWLHHLTTTSARNPELARRRRPWVILGTLAVPLAATLALSPTLAGRIGWLPAASAVMLAASVIMLRRRTGARRARRQARAQPPAPTWQQAAVIHDGQWAATPRTAALERLVGELIINLGDTGLSVSDAITALSRCSVLSRSLLLAGVEANLTVLAHLEQQALAGQAGLSPIGEAAIPWLFEFQARLRHLVGSGVGHIPDVVDGGHW